MFFWEIAFFIYLFCFVLNTVFNNKYRNLLGCFIIFFSTCVSVFRNNIGLDYYEYQIMFDAADCSNIGSVEPTFTFLSILIKELGLTSQALFATYAVLTSVFFWFGLKGFLKNNFFAINNFLLLYCVYIQGWFWSMNTIRQHLALAAFFWCSRFIVENQKIKYILCIILIGLVHYSAFFMLPLVFWNKHNIRERHIILVATLMIVLINDDLFYKLIVSLVTSLPFKIYKVTDYILISGLTTTNFFEGSGMGVVLEIIIFIYSIYLGFKLKRQNLNVNFIIWVVVYGIILKYLFYFCPPLTRLFRYAIPFFFLLLSDMNFNKKSFVQITILFFICIYFTTISILAISNIPYRDQSHVTGTAASHNTNLNIDYRFTCDFIL